MSAQKRLIDPRPYQVRIKNRLATGWRDGVISQIVVAPCGAGKTVMGFLSAREFVHDIAPKKYGVKPEEVGVFWMAMRRNLLTQTRRDNGLFAPDGEEFYCPMQYVSSFDNNPDPGKFKIRLLISDEAHHSSTISETNILSAIRPNHVLGLSATPDRKDQSQLCFQLVHRDAGYRVLINEGYLSSFAHYSLQEYSPKKVAAAYVADPGRWGKSLMFFRTSEECEECAEVLRQHGVKTSINLEDGEVGIIVKSGTDRASQLDAFENGGFDVLISMGILTEGFNCPSLNTVFVRDTTSDLQATQMAGRVLRLHAGCGIKNIVQSNTCQHPFIRHADPAEQYVQQQDCSWASLKPSKLARRLMEEVAKRVKLTPRLDPLPDWNQTARDIKFLTQTQYDKINNIREV